MKKLILLLALGAMFTQGCKEDKCYKCQTVDMLGNGEANKYEDVCGEDNLQQKIYESEIVTNEQGDTTKYLQWGCNTVPYN